MYGEEYFSFIKHLNEDHVDPTLVVLKGHLLLELALREYIGRRVNFPDRLSGVQVNFSSLVVFSSTLEDCNSHQWVWAALKRANALRNQLAHNLEPKKYSELESKFIDYVFEKYSEIQVEVEDTLVSYSKLATAILMVFDALCSTYPAKEEGKRNK